jgi:hypothetical protein
MISLGGLVNQKAFGKFEMGKVVSNPFANAFIKEAEGEDHEVSMGQNQLDTIIKMATELKAKMGENEKEIPAWIQDHISKAENYISQAAGNYHEYGTNESVNEVTYNFGKVQYTDKNMTPVQILDLAMAYVQTPITKIVGNKHEFRIRSANDLAKLTGTTQSDVKVRGKQPALILFLLKNKLVSKEEYTKLYKDLLAKQMEVIKYLKNSSPEMRNSGGAARAAAKDMKGEFDLD